MKILRLIDNFSLKNAGIWKVASETCGQWGEDAIYFTSKGELPQALKSKKAFYVNDWQNESWDIIESHGLWQWNTKAANAFAKKHNIPWVAVPHGMLEVWSMQQKALKKKLYFNLVEYPLLKKASVIKAVSIPEAENLKKHFGTRVHHLYNPIQLPDNSHFIKEDTKHKFVFLGRLHHKKNPLMLLEAWQISGLFKNPDTELVFAGPNDGAQDEMESFIKSKKLGNVKLLGAIYGNEKHQLLSSAHTFVLASSSEGLPSTAVEAMAYKMQCILSAECNFPEAFQFNSVVKTELSADALSKSLKIAFSEKPSIEVLTKAMDFAIENFSVDSVVLHELSLYHNAINK